MEFIACDPVVTTPLDPDLKYACTVNDLAAEMSRLRIGAAMVRHLACEQAGPCSGNRILMEEIAGRDDLLPVWALTPDGAPPGFDCVATVRQMLDEGVRAAWMTPDVHDYSPAPWCCGELYDVLRATRVPLLVDYAGFGPDAVHAACDQFPNLRTILLKVPRAGRHRRLYALLKRHEHLHVCFGPSFSMSAGFRGLCNDFGPSRWVLGTGFPDSEGGAGITGLTYSGVGDEAVEAIAAGTITRLLKEVRCDVL